jgi:hypothetical protein
MGDCDCVSHTARDRLGAVNNSAEMGPKSVPSAGKWREIEAEGCLNAYVIRGCIVLRPMYKRYHRSEGHAIINNSSHNFGHTSWLRMPHVMISRIGDWKYIVIPLNCVTHTDLLYNARQCAIRVMCQEASCSSGGG